MPSIRSIKLPFKVPVSPTVALDRFVNVFIIEGEELALVDAGVKGSEKAIFQQVRAMGRRPNEIAQLILTHSHPDHIGAAAEVVAATGCQVVAHRAERTWIEDPAVQKAERPVPGFDALVSGPVRVDRTVADGDDVGIAGFAMKAVHTPGHSPGSITLWSPAERVAVTGDAVPVPGDVPIYDDAFETLGSLRRLRSLGMEVMLSAWADPLEGYEVNKRLDDAAQLVQTVHRSVVRNSATMEMTPALMEAVVRDIGLPREQINPMLARTVMSHLRYKFNVSR
ncbi:MAG: MBL fold metallo-hydrolase [Methanomassiliicoccus sp.]|nr:MBL fold metallo-hydrolase [Methanomassiliicoccus sp.]